MPIDTITVKHHFSAGHRIPGLIGEGAKCANAHGHTFGVEVEIQQPPTADQGSGKDHHVAAQLEFGAVKKLIRGWIDEKFDHGYIVWRDDDIMLPFLRANNMKHYVLQGKPTTELIASEIMGACRALFNGYRIARVHVTEGPHNAATCYSTGGPA